MMLRLSKKHYSLLFLLLFLVFVLFCYMPIVTIALALPTKLCYLPHEIRLQWRHSVEKTLWREYYHSDGQKLWLSHNEIQTFGAGVEAQAELIAAEQGFIGQKVNHILPELRWVISRHMQGEIHWQAQGDYQKWALYQALPDYTVVQFYPAKIRRILFWQEQCDDSIN